MAQSLTPTPCTARWCSIGRQCEIHSPMHVASHRRSAVLCIPPAFPPLRRYWTQSCFGPTVPLRHCSHFGIPSSASLPPPSVPPFFGLLSFSLFPISSPFSFLLFFFFSFSF